MSKGRAILSVLFGLAWLAGFAQTEIFQARLETYNPRGNTIILKRTDNKPDVNATLYRNARLWMNRRPVTVDQFRQMEGQTVVVRMSVGTQVRPVIREMADPDTWEWLMKVRRGVVQGKLRGVEGNYLLIEFEDGSQFAYRYTPNTRWERDDKPAKLEDFAIGETLYLAPRLLSNLDTVLLSVSNAEKGAEVGRERALPSLKGTIEAIDRQRKVIRFLTQGGDLREVYYDEETEFTFQGKVIKPEQIKPPARATVHRVRDEEGKDYARKVTIQPN